MRWWILLIMAIIAVGLDTGLVGVFTLRGLGHATPSIAACLLGFVALQARPRAALWAAFVIGLMLDLSPGSSGAAGGVPIIGPRTLGSIAAAQVVLLLRPVVFRRRVVTVAVIAGVAAACIGLGSASVETIRWWAPWTHALAPPPAGARMLTIAGSSVYTVLLGIPVGAILLGTNRWWRFGAAPGRLDYAASRR
jgi:cell shape-determining protein MreD